MLDTCYLNDEDLAQSLLVRALEPFGLLTCMDIAQLAEDQEFIAHSSCQILFNRLWMGGIVLDTPWWKVNLTFQQFFLKLFGYWSPYIYLFNAQPLQSFACNHSKAKYTYRSSLGPYTR